MRERIALGTVQFGLAYGVANQGGQVPLDEVRRILAAAKSHGMQTLDTAISYGNSEQALGECGVAGWQVVTKLPPIHATCLDVRVWVEEEIRRSLLRLNVTSVHAVLLHRPDQLFGDQGADLLNALIQIQASGRTERIGVSIYAPDELEPLFALHPFGLVQAPLSILDRRLVETGWLSRLQAMGVELHTRSAFLQGLLLMSGAQRPAKFSRWQTIWNEWDRWLVDSGLSPLQACLRYALSLSEVDRVVVGVESLAHLEEIMSALDGELHDLPRWPHAPDLELINPAHWNQL